MVGADSLLPDLKQLYLCVRVYVDVYAGTHGGQKRGLELLELGL